MTPHGHTLNDVFALPESPQGFGPFDFLLIRHFQLFELPLNPLYPRLLPQRARHRRLIVVPVVADPAPESVDVSWPTSHHGRLSKKTLSGQVDLPTPTRTMMLHVTISPSPHFTTTTTTTDATKYQHQSVVCHKGGKQLHQKRLTSLQIALSITHQSRVARCTACATEFSKNQKKSFSINKRKYKYFSIFLKNLQKSRGIFFENFKYIPRKIFH